MIEYRARAIVENIIINLNGLTTGSSGRTIDIGHYRIGSLYADWQGRSFYLRCSRIFKYFFRGIGVHIQIIITCRQISRNRKVFCF